MNDKEQLAAFVGEERASEILKLTKAYDKYVEKFKKRLDSLLEDVNYEVRTGIVFSEKPKGD